MEKLYKGSVMTSELDLQARDHGDKLLDDIGRIYRDAYRNWTGTQADVDALALEIQRAIDPYIQNTKPATKNVNPPDAPSRMMDEELQTTKPTARQSYRLSQDEIDQIAEDIDKSEPILIDESITYEPADDARPDWVE